MCVLRLILASGFPECFGGGGALCSGFWGVNQKWFPVGETAILLMLISQGLRIEGVK